MRTFLTRLSTRLSTRLLTRLQAALTELEDDTGQATTEYALVLLGAALVALLVVAWATGGGAGKIGALFDRVIDSVLSHV